MHSVRWRARRQKARWGRLTTSALIALATVASGTAAAAAAPLPRRVSVAHGSAAEGTVAAKSSPSKQARARHAAMLAPANATGALSTVSSVTVNGGYTAAGIGMRNLGYGVISITGVPGGATVKSATLLWDILANQPDPTFAQGKFNGTPITGTEWVSGASPCWNIVSSNFSYVADVTRLVTGNGYYNLAGFATGESDGADPWYISQQAPPLLEGASLVVVYTLASMPQTTIQIAEGATETDSGNTASATLSGFTASASSSATTTYIVADGQAAGNTASFNGTTLPNVGFPGADPLAVPNYSRGNLWDTVTTEVSSLVSTGDTSAALGVTGYNDCLVWVGQVLAVGNPGRVVAMGDSYMSGEGTYPAVDYFPETAIGQDTCHRSPASYAILLGVAKSNFVACSGATISDLENAYKTEPKQLNVLASDVRVVLLSITGDDAGFGTVLSKCIDVPLLYRNSFFDCLNAVETALAKLPAIRQNLASLFGIIHQLAPAAQIVLVGYPHLFPPLGSGPGCNWIAANRQRLINSAGDVLDNMLSNTASGYSYVTYVDTRALFFGHEICGSSTPWINDLQTDNLLAHNCPSSYLVSGICSQSFHPNVLGYAAEEQLLKPVLASLTNG
jgi:hypothetical protein